MVTGFGNSDGIYALTKRAERMDEEDEYTEVALIWPDSVYSENYPSDEQKHSFLVSVMAPLALVGVAVVFALGYWYRTKT